MGCECVYTCVGSGYVCVSVSVSLCCAYIVTVNMRLILVSFLSHSSLSFSETGSLTEPKAHLSTYLASEHQEDACRHLM